MAEKKVVDWEAIEREYRAGILSLREIARLYEVSDTAIRKTAKAKLWERDLTAKVQEKVRNELVRAEVRSDNVQTDREIVEQAAATVVQVVRSHRKGIAQGRDIVELLMTQLTDVAGRRSEFEEAIELECEDDDNGKRRTKLMKAISIPAHAGTVRDLSTALKNLIVLERQAFSVDAGGSDDPDKPPSGDPMDAARRVAFILAQAINKGPA